jgi:hypothetical protein
MTAPRAGLSWNMTVARPACGHFSPRGGLGHDRFLPGTAVPVCRRGPERPRGGPAADVPAGRPLFTVFCPAAVGNVGERGCGGAAPDPGGTRNLPAPGDPMYRRNRSCRRRRLPAVAAWQEPVDPGDRWLRQAAGAARVVARPGQPGHGCTAVARSQPARIAGGQIADGHGGACGLICCECGGNRYLGYCQACPCWRKIRGPGAIGEGGAACGQHPGLPSQAGGTTFRKNPAGEAP